MTMMEDQNASLYDPKSPRKETPLTFESNKVIYELNDSITDTIPEFEATDGDECWNSKVMNEISMDCEKVTIDPTKEDHNELSRQLSGWEKGADSLSLYSNDKDKEDRSPKHENSVTAEEFTHLNENESSDSSSPCNGASHLSETETSLFTDKNVLESEMPELEVCDEEINDHIVKDICIDEGWTEKDSILIESCEDNKSDHLFPMSSNNNDQIKATVDSSVEKSKSLSADQCGSREDDGAKFVALGTLESSSDISEEYDPDHSLLTGEAISDATGKPTISSSEEDPLVDKILPIEEFGAQNNLRSLLNSFDGEGSKATELPDQIPIGIPVSDIPAPLEEDAQASSLLYKSNVESGSITFNFNSHVPVTENVEEQSNDSGDVHKDVSAISLSDSGLVQCTSSSTENVHEQSLIIEDGDSDDSQVQCASTKEGNDKNDDDQSHEPKNGDSNDISTDGQVQFPSETSQSTTNNEVQAVELNVPPTLDFSTDGQVQFPSNTSQSSTNDDVQAVEPNVPPKHEHKNSSSSSVSFFGPLQHDEGETSFSAVTYSGPIAFSGSLSHRSDGSAASTRSFAFPVLQSDWNSSPVRMAKADRRHFRKHKGWRSGLLCCRF